MHVSIPFASLSMHVYCTTVIIGVAFRLAIHYMIYLTDAENISIVTHYLKEYLHLYSHSFRPPMVLE